MFIVIKHAFYTGLINAKLNIILIQTMPKNNAKRLHLFACETFPTLYREYPTTIFTKPHTTLTVGDDKPLPGGFANGVGKLSPEIP